MQLRLDDGLLDSNDMDIEMEAMNRHCSLIKQRRNSRTTTWRLPPELLSVVFDWARVGWGPQRLKWRLPVDGSMHDTYTAGWTTITHVCHRWREVGGPGTDVGDTRH